MAFYKQSTAYTRTFKMIDSSDHISKKTGLTCTVNISKAGGSFGAAGGTVTEVANGWYKVALTTTDTNTIGDLSFYITASGADDTDFVDRVWVRDLADLAYPATSGRSMVVDASGLVDANMVKMGPTGSGTAQTARDIGASVLLSTGTGTGQLDFTSGVVKANATQWLGGTIPAVNVTGVPLVDAKYLLGTILSTPATAGILDVNIKNIANAAVSTSSAQIGVNAVNVGGTAQTGRDIGASVLLSAGTGTGQLDFTSGVVKANATQWLSGTIPAVNVTGVPLVDLKYTLGTISPATAGSVRADAVTGSVGSVTGAVGSVSGAVGSVTARVTANTDQISGSAAAATNLERSATAIVIGTVGSASTTTSIVTSSLDPAAAATDQYKGRIVIFDRATTTTNLRGQATNITASTAGGVLTVTALTDAAVSGDTFTIT